MNGAEYLRGTNRLTDSLCIERNTFMALTGLQVKTHSQQDIRRLERLPGIYMYVFRKNENLSFILFVNKCDKNETSQISGG